MVSKRLHNYRYSVNEGVKVLYMWIVWIIDHQTIFSVVGQLNVLRKVGV